MVAVVQCFFFVVGRDQRFTDQRMSVVGGHSERIVRVCGAPVEVVVLPTWSSREGNCLACFHLLRHQMYKDDKTVAEIPGMYLDCDCGLLEQNDRHFSRFQSTKFSSSTEATKMQLVTRAQHLPLSV